MKLLFLHSVALYSGKANALQVLHMCRAYSELGIDVTLAVPARKAVGQEELRAAAEAQIGQPIGFRIQPYRKFNFGGRFNEIGGLWGAQRLLQSQTADLCVTRSPAYVPLTIRRGIPTVFEAHNSILHDNPILNRLRSAKLLRNCQREELVAFVAISSALAKFWSEAGVPKEKVIALHDGVDFEQFRNAPRRGAIRKKLGLHADRKIVVYTGSLYADRDIDGILELAKAFPHTRFVVVGGPDEKARSFAAGAAGKGIANIEFTGRVPHARVKDYLFAADILLMVWSRRVRTMNYCSPLKVFEYMAAGRTIVGHGFPTIREVLTHGKDALLCDPDSFDDLCGKLSQALAMPTENAMADAARDLVRREYSWATRAKRLISHVDALTAPKPSRGVRRDAPPRPPT